MSFVVRQLSKTPAIGFLECLGHQCLPLADKLDVLFRDDAFAALFPTHG
jgi:hypothetical protein